MAATFGRKVSSQQAYDAEMARRRAEFVAAERARAADGDPGLGHMSPASVPPIGGAAGTGNGTSRLVVIAEKSVATAYILWFFLGVFSVHRFYLGHSTSGAMQFGLWLVGWGLVLGASFGGIFLLIVWMVWLLGDAFLIPGMARASNEQARRAATAYAFA